MPYGRVHLIVDGFNLALVVEPYSTRRYTVFVYVNGVWSGKMMSEDCDERRRFYRRSRKCAMRPKEVKSYQQACGKRAAAKFKEKMTFDIYYPNWDSFRALRRHLIAANESIAFAEGYGPADGEVR